MGLQKAQEASSTGPMVYWVVPVVFVVISIAIALSGDLGREWLRYDRPWLMHGETWRLFSAHFTHLGWSHLFLNLAGLLLIWFLIGGEFTTRQWLLNSGIIIAVIDLGFWFLNPELYWYVGMSGLLHGLLCAALLSRLRKANAETVLLIALVVGKLAWEQLAGPMPGSTVTSGGPVIVDAHLYGAAGGVLAAVLGKIRVPPRPTI